jgi:ABC-type antimicrobial peptide transport system permease subunit
VHETDSRAVIWRLDAVDQLFADAVARPRLVLMLMVVFAALGLVLAAAGIYGVLSYAVVQRHREIGIRLALGARPESVGRLILHNGLMLTAAGLAAGVALALALVRVMRTLLYEVEPTDPASVAGVVAILCVVAALASWRPARRAMRVDPVTLLRQE